ncbi:MULTISPECIES: hypothetical protein [Bacillus]|nr:hypothetical protein [Bacillus sonorensis]
MINITPPQISEETMKEMAKFFMKTSIPRILEAERKGELDQIKPVTKAG